MASTDQKMTKMVQEGIKKAANGKTPKVMNLDDYIAEGKKGFDDLKKDKNSTKG